MRCLFSDKLWIDPQNSLESPICSGKREVFTTKDGTESMSSLIYDAKAPGFLSGAGIDLTRSDACGYWELGFRCLV